MTRGGRRPAAWLILLGLLALAAAACMRRCGEQTEEARLDLAARAWLADRSSSREMVLFGAPGAERFMASGFHWETDGTAYAWASPECEVRFRWDKPQDRQAVVDLEASPGNLAQEAEVSLNGVRVGGFAVSEGVERHPVRLPAAAQRPGDNRLTFRFAQSSPLTPGAVRRMAARFNSLVVGLATDSGIDDLLMREAPAVRVAQPSDQPRDIVLIGPASISFTLHLHEDAELRVTPTLHPAARAAGADVDVAVLAQMEGELPQALWTAVLGPRSPEPGEVKVMLPAAESDEPIRLTLQVTGAADARFAWVTWGSPHVVGPAPIPADPAMPAAPTGRRRARPRGMPDDAGVILVVLDAARAESLGAYGYARPTTPEIDRIAREGVVFERAYTPAVHTLGAMSSVWTSLYPDAHHRGLPFAVPLPDGHPTLAEALGASGVPSFGVIANAMAGRANGLDRGFQTFREIYDHPRLGSRAEVFRQGVDDLLELWRGRFLAYLHYREPHFPYDPPAPYATRFGPDSPLTTAQRGERDWYTQVNEGATRPTSEDIAHLVRLYDGNLAYADAEIGRLRRTLEARGIWERSVVIVTADHGEQLFEEGYIGHSAQVREESARIPLIMRFPTACGLQGRRVADLVDLVDLAATIAEVLGVDWPPAGWDTSGRSLLPVLDGQQGKGATLVRTVWERPEYALVTDNWKLFYQTRTGKQRLVDLGRDPDERDDLSERYPVRSSALRQALFAWVERLARGPQMTAAHRTMSREECENLCALGYLDCADCE